MGTRELETRVVRRRVSFHQFVVAASLAFAVGQASANHPGGDHNNGKPSSKASLLSLTTCALSSDYRQLEVTTTLTNKSTGGIVPTVIGGTISGTYKMSTASGKDFKTFDMKDVCFLVGGCDADVDPELTITAEFPLCKSTGGVIDAVNSARELNGLSSVDYKASDGSGGIRTVENRCKDADSDGKGGIKMDEATKDAIEAACASQ
jgi:hypothetical protein